MNNYKNILLVILLGGSLGIPFLLKIFNASLEVYPSIRLPSGGKTIINKKDSITFSTIQLVGITSHNQKHKELNHKQFLNPIPVHYLQALIKNNFGLDDENKIHVLEAQLWLRQKLIAQQCLDSNLIIKQIQILLPKNEKTIKYETVLSLY